MGGRVVLVSRHMNLPLLFSFAETFRRETIGEPIFVSPSGAFEYPNGGIEVVVVLKVLRAAQGLRSLEVLCREGLLIDLGVIYRCVSDALSEVYFLLEKYPERSVHVEQFVKGFFETTLDNHLSRKTPHVPAQKIQSAMVRVLTDREKDEDTRIRILRIYETFSGYVHANYSHVMQNYGGPPQNVGFNLSGVPSARMRQEHMELVEQAYLSVRHVLAFAARALGKPALSQEVMQCC